MSGRYCAKHEEWAPTGECRWCEPRMTFTADVPSGVFRSREGHDIEVHKTADIRTGLVMYMPSHDAALCALCRGKKA